MVEDMPRLRFGTVRPRGQILGPGQSPPLAKVIRIRACSTASSIATWRRRAPSVEMFSASWIRYSRSQYRAGTRHGPFGHPGSRPASGQRGPLDRFSEAAESAPDCLLRRPHCGLRPALGGRERAVLGDEPPKSRDRLRDPGIGHVG